MANILEKVIQGTLDIEVLKKYLKDEKKECCSHDLSVDIPTFDAGKFVPYFLNYIREESTCHFTSELPVISPKKIKKKRRYPRNVKSSSDTSSNTVKARESLFKSSPSNKDTLPLSVNSQYLGSSSCESKNKKDHLFTSTPVKFNLDEDFPTIHDVSTRNSVTPTRRITPTPVRTRRNSSTIFNNSSTSCETSDESSHSFREERQTKGQHHNASRNTWNSRKHSVKFKLEDFMHQGSRTPNLSSCQVKAPFGPQHNKNKISQLSVDVKNCSDSLSESENNKNSLNSSFQESPKEELFPPKLDSVTDSDVLDKLAVIHSFCILENLVPNIVIEMSFILQLLTVEVNSDVEKEATTKGILSGHHNCMYYATVALQKLFGIIKLLDKGTLRLLLDNKAIMEFSRSFHDDLASLYPTISISEVPYSLLKSPLNCVPFQVNFDNRNNFSSEQTFHYFKRQRDMFYEIIRTWESQNGKSGWSLPEHLGDRIRQVVDEKCGLTNIVHFVRLFQSQLIQMCCYESTLPTFNEGESPEFVGELFKSNPKKFFRLKKRLVTPQSRTSDPCPPPGFTETEEFFRTFIVAATRHV
ncbi:codanin-1-like [Xenia sp. Carnegie-2017]|uniref:codanin-1-like n=1 Tax=Xenia sp. Carnegie-2017 TaxID=2897299 RepID=UPI001F04F62C|nr:codanin-1-like [Xenia sp. Carnegie-2017]